MEALVNTINLTGDPGQIRAIVVNFNDGSKFRIAPDIRTLTNDGEGYHFAQLEGKKKATPGHTREQSYRDIMARARRIQKELAFMGWDEEAETYNDAEEQRRGLARAAWVRAITQVYGRNIAQYLHIPNNNPGFVPYFTNKQYDTPVPPEAYRGI